MNFIFDTVYQASPAPSKFDSENEFECKSHRKYGKKQVEMSSEMASLLDDADAVRNVERVVIGRQPIFANFCHF
jgi:hypothetical protein